MSPPLRWIVGDDAPRIGGRSAFIDAYGITDPATRASPPGPWPARMHTSLGRFAREVMPVLTHRHAAQADIQGAHPR